MLGTILINLAIPYYFTQTDHLLNRYRSVQDKPTLEYSQELSNLAKERACYIDPIWEKFNKYYQKTGKHYKFDELDVSGEVISWNWNWPGSLREWVASPKHNHVLLGDYQEYGVGQCGEIKVLLTE